MSDADQQYKGNNRQKYDEFLDTSIPAKSDLALVRRCNRRIKRALAVLDMERRRDDAKKLDAYLDPPKVGDQRDDRGKVKF